MAGRPKKNQEAPSEKRRATLGVLFWIACILLVLVVFLLTRDNISSVMENTGFIEVITRGNEGAGDDAGNGPADNGAGSATPSNSDTAIEVLKPEEQPGDPQDASPAGTTGGNAAPANAAEPASGSGSNSGSNTGSSVSSSSSSSSGSNQIAAESDRRVRSYRVYFAKVGDEGNVSIEARSRNVSFVDSPLTATIHTLLAGPGAEDERAGFINAIPTGSQLISASIRGTTAFLDFNEAFSFNPLGYEGQKAQLQQIVFTATEFSTVSEVQILIQGQKINYLSGEGVFIGAPLKRGSF